MILKEELYCCNCKLHSAPNYFEYKDKIVAKCFWCEDEIKVYKKTMMPYGKYKGKFVDDFTDIDYLEWIQKTFDCKYSKFIVNAVDQRLQELNINQTEHLGICKINNQ